MQLNQFVKFRTSSIATIFLVLLVSGISIAAEISGAWRKSEVSLDSSATIYLSNIFGNKRGKFRATPESVLDNKDSIDGKFVVATYRYVYFQPEIDGRGITSDELISTELLDCERHFYGTLRQVRKFSGKIVSDHITPDADVMMIETTSPTIDSQLCEFYKKKKIGVLNRGNVNNSTYNPSPKEKDVDSTINKYSPDYAPTSAFPNIIRFVHGLVCASATANRGTIAAMSARRLKRYWTSARYRRAYFANLNA